MNKAYPFRLYPNTEQRIVFAKTFGCVRFIYNRMLADQIACYKQTKEKLSNTPAQYKAEFPWLQEVDSLALANAQMNLQTAYKNFFRNPKAGFPKIKSATVSITPTGKYYVSVLFEYNTAAVPPVEPVKVVGLDFSMHELFVDSEERSAAYPRFYRQALERLAREQRKLPHCKKGSRNREKQRKRVALLHEKNIQSTQGFSA